jgi:hypothetical protein
MRLRIWAKSCAGLPVAMIDFDVVRRVTPLSYDGSALREARSST